MLQLYCDYMENKNMGINILITISFVIGLGIVFTFVYGGLWQGLVFVLGLVLLLFLVLYRSKFYKYQCPKCKKKFKIDFRKGLLSFSFKKNKKYLACPYCSYVGWAKEVEVKKNGKK